PREALAGAWRTLLTCQFHDILPGSSIALVNADARADLERVEAAAEALASDALQALAEDGPPVPFNTTSWPRREPVEVDGELRLADTPPYGTGTFVEPRDAVRVEELADGGVRLENAELSATLSAGGELRSLIHRPSARESLSAPGNVLELYDDWPV